MNHIKNNKKFFLLMLLIALKINSQNIESLKMFDGDYFLMKKERSVQLDKEGTSVKKIQINKHDNSIFKDNNAILLTTSECERCTPSVFTYKEENSKRLNKPVFYNSMGLYMIAYDKDSFVYVMPLEELGGNWSTVTFFNFYSKNKQKVNTMTKARLMSYIELLSKDY